QLELGMPLHQLQHQLGHSDIRTTQSYLHWLPELGHGGIDLLTSWGNQ
ncbi:site-specific integrase, partial [Pseudoalteromonas sp. SG45-2]|nr:site-specific integrase [Pseudoalteromonas sp. SG45-2]